MFSLFLKKPRNLKDDLLSGLTVSLALVPEAVAFAFVAGVDPFVGLYAAFMVGLITSIFGGRPGMISGATGAMAVVMTPFVVMYGTKALFFVIILTGIIQIIAGFLKMGKFIRLLPHPVMLGFVNGLAIVIGLAQFNQFKTDHKISYNEEQQSFFAEGSWLQANSQELWIMIFFIALTMLIIYFLPKFTKAVPASLAAIIICTLICYFTPLKSKTVTDAVNQQRLLQKEKEIKNKQFTIEKQQYTVQELKEKGKEKAQEKLSSDNFKDVPQGLKAQLPSLIIPEIQSSWSFWKTSLILALTLASIGLIESLMTLSLIDEITESKGNSNRECLAQGLGNVATGFFGGMGGCAMIGQSMININSGGRGRTSGISAALFLLCFIIFAPKLIEIIPIASLIGVMFMVVLATFEFSSLRLINKVPKSDIIIIVAVSTITVFIDLAVAVGVGIIIAALVYAWNSGKHLRLDTIIKTDNSTTYEVHGVVFFGSTSAFNDLFDIKNDTKQVILDFKNSRVSDHSGIEALHNISKKYKKQGKELHLKNLSNRCKKMLEKANSIIDINLA